MAAVGRMVAGTATVEYCVAVLVAVTEGHRDQAAGDRAIDLIKKDGAPVRELRTLVVRTSLRLVGDASLRTMRS